MSVVEAVQHDLAGLGDLAGSALAASALALARELDDARSEEACEECGHVQEFTVGGNSATSKSMCAKELRETMERLRALAPVREEEDEIERARKRRADRLARQSAAGAASSS